MFSLSTLSLGAFAALTISVELLLTSKASTSPPPVRAIAHCAWDVVEFGLRDAPDTTLVIDLGDVSVTARYLAGSDEHAVFTLRRGKQTMHDIDLPDLGNPNGWLAVASNRKNFAVTWSNAGAAGGWDTRLFSFKPDGSLEENTSIMSAIENDFEPRHYCKTRGDNFEAVRWMDDDHILVAASVYGTSDCGKETGYTEGYLMKFSTSAIERRLTERQLLDPPMVCTWNIWQPPPLVNSKHGRRRSRPQP